MLKIPQTDVDYYFMKVNVCVKILAVILLASCQRVKFESDFSTLDGSSKETLSILSPLKGSFINSITTPSVVVSGTCDVEGSTITVEPTSQKSRCVGGTYTATLDLLSQLDDNITLTVEMNTGHIPVIESVTVIKDTVAPKIAITSPVAGSYVNSSTQNSYPVSGTCDLDGATISFNPTSVTTTCMSGSFSKNLNLSAQPEGNIKITASIKDPAENSSSSSVTVKKDTTGPQVTLGSASPNNVGIGNPVSFSVTYTDAASVNLTSAKVTFTGDTTECVVSVLNGTTQTPTVKLSDCSSTSGQVTVQIQKGTAQDSLGNLALASNTQSVVVKNGEPFVAVYKINSDNMILDLPLKPALNYNFKINWGDGTPVQTVTSDNDPDKNHTYATTGTYTVTIRGLMEGYGATGWNDKRPYQTQILSVSNLGAMGWKDLSYAFYNAINLTTIEGGNTAKVTNMAGMFQGANQANPDVSKWDTSSVTNMAGMFSGATQANPDVDEWDTSKVTNMPWMFSDADQADPDVEKWDTSSVTNMAGMFYGADQANPDVEKWNTSSVINMSGMFYGADQANPDVSEWNTSSVTNMSGMFRSANQANPNVSKWNTSNVTNIKEMFYGAIRANPDISEWSLESIKEDTWGGYYWVDQFFDSNTYINLTTINYSNFLIKLANSVANYCEPSSSSCIIKVGNVKYNSSARSARNALVNNGWNIYDGGQQ